MSEPSTTPSEPVTVRPGFRERWRAAWNPPRERSVTMPLTGPLGQTRQCSARFSWLEPDDELAEQQLHAIARAVSVLGERLQREHGITVRCTAGSYQPTWREEL